MRVQFTVEAFLSTTLVLATGSSYDHLVKPRLNCDLNFVIKSSLKKPLP